MTKVLVGNLRGPKGDKGDPGDPGTGGGGLDTTGATEGETIAFIGGAIQWIPFPAQTGGIVGAPSTWPSLFPPMGHTHPVSQLEDASSVAKAFLQARDAQEARAAIGAGTGNGTSNLQLGSGGTQAAPGNHGHNADTLTFTPTAGSPITATTVKAAIEQAAATGGGGGGGTGTSSVLVVKFASGQYPALPATKPAGVTLILFKGPVQPTTGNVSGGIPAYVGDGSTQIMADYEYRNLT